MTDENPYYSGSEDYNYYAEDNFNKPVEEKPVKSESRRVVELFAGGIFVVLLILMTVLFLGMADKDSSKAVSNVVTNSYNSDSYNEEVKYVAPTESVTTYRSVTHPYSNKIMYVDGGSPCGYVLPVKYVSRGEKVTSDRFLGDTLDNYYVYVKNNELEDEYFTVRFNFYDRAGNEDTELLTRYIQSGQEEVFTYRDVYLGGHEFVKWDYNVITETYNVQDRSTKVDTLTKSTIVTNSYEKNLNCF